jgi:hypothetical protein
MGVDIMRPGFNFEPKYRVTTLTMEDWTKGTGTPTAVKGLVWFTDGSKMREGARAEVFGQSVGREAQLFSRKICYSLSGQNVCYFGVYL